MPIEALVDYAGYERAVGLDWYQLDPNLAFLLDHYLVEELVGQ